MEAAADTDDRKSWISRFALLRREVLAGVPFAFALLPTCLTSALLAFAPLGPDYIARGATLGLYAISSAELALRCLRPPRSSCIRRGATLR